MCGDGHSATSGRQRAPPAAAGLAPRRAGGAAGRRAQKRRYADSGRLPAPAPASAALLAPPRTGFAGLAAALFATFRAAPLAAAPPALAPLPAAAGVLRSAPPAAGASAPARAPPALSPPPSPPALPRLRARGACGAALATRPPAASPPASAGACFGACFVDPVRARRDRALGGRLARSRSSSSAASRPTSSGAVPCGRVAASHPRPGAPWCALEHRRTCCIAA